MRPRESGPETDQEGGNPGDEPRPTSVGQYQRPTRNPIPGGSTSRPTANRGAMPASSRHDFRGDGSGSVEFQ
jgi:hypothetical protein